MFAEERRSQTHRVDWDFGGLATERDKQPVSFVAAILSYPLWVMRLVSPDKQWGIHRSIGLLWANSKDDVETTCHVSHELEVFSGYGCKTSKLPSKFSLKNYLNFVQTKINSLFLTKRHCC